jgi:hypothetical protein
MKMLRTEFKSTVPVWPMVMAAVAALTLGLGWEAVAEQDQATEAVAAAEATLTSLGLDLEAARLKAAMGDRTSVESLAHALARSAWS